MSSRSPIRNSNGTAALYTLLLVPFALLLSGVMLDVSGWNSLRDTVQQQADELAFDAAGATLSLTEARDRIALLVAKRNLNGTEWEVTSDRPGALKVTLRGRYRSHFEPLFAPFLANALTVERSASAGVVPGDFVMIVADGASLRPQPVPEAGIPGSYSLPSWGNSVEWPPSPYFSCVSPPNVAENNPLQWRWWEVWKTYAFRRWATQACFNPVFSEVKSAAIDLAETLLRNETNRLAVLYSPGDSSGRGYRVLRHIHRESDQPNTYREQKGGFAAFPDADAEWSDYVDLERLMGDEICMLLSQSESGLLPVYGLPNGSPSSCSELVSLPACGARHFPSGHLTECARENLSLRDAIYWNTAKLRTPGFDAEPNIVSSLTEAWNQLADGRTSALDRERRGNLASIALRQVFLLTDSLPPLSDELLALLEQYRSHNIELAVLPFFHPGLSAQQESVLRERSSEWSALAGRQPHIHLIESERLEKLRAESVPRAVAHSIQFALRS